MNHFQNIISAIQPDLAAVEELMHAQAAGQHPDLSAALDLLLNAGGKRIRPIFTLTIGRLLGAPHQDLLRLAASVELLHTATLVHDDLIDGSLLRRGMPTLNSQWSPGATVLTGDFLFACSARLAASTNSIAVMDQFAQTLTTIVNGEITQLFTSRCLASRPDYYQRIYAKTASLFESATCLPVFLTESSEEMTEGMRRFGRNLGMAFQIVDDILDFTGQQATTGKPVGEDLSQGLVTLPALIYIEAHPEDEDGRRLLAGECISEAGLNAFMAAILEGDAISKSRQEAGKYLNDALEELKRLPAGTERQLLEDVARYIVERNA